MAKMGRPTKYDPKFAEQAAKLCALGATDPQLADFFEVGLSTISLWKVKHLDFMEAIKDAKHIADRNVERSLYQRAMGYSHEDSDVRVIGQEVVITPLVKHYPPDTAAAIFWLKNRKKEEWRDKVETEHSGNIGVQVTLSKDDAEI